MCCRMVVRVKTEKINNAQISLSQKGKWPLNSNKWTSIVVCIAACAVNVAGMRSSSILTEANNRRIAAAAEKAAKIHSRSIQFRYRYICV